MPSATFGAESAGTPGGTVTPGGTWVEAPFAAVPVSTSVMDPGVFEVPWGDIAAASMLASVPPLVLVVGLQRYLIRGLLAGALRE